MTSCPVQDLTGTSNVKPKFMFVVEWYDPVAQLVKKFLMTFYAIDQSVELYDIKNHRVFLRRCKQDGIQLENLYKSATVTVMSRQLKIVDYADSVTRNKFEEELVHTFCMVKPDVIPKIGEIVSYMQKEGFKIIKMRMGRMTHECASNFYKEHEGKSFLPGLLSFMSSGASIAMLVIGVNAMKRWRELIGPLDSEEAKRIAPHTLRAIYGTDAQRNGVHGSKDDDHVIMESEIWFPKSKQQNSNDILSTCVGKNTTCCIVKPHALLEGKLGGILNFIIDKGFTLTALEMFTLDVPTAEEFFEIYKGVVPEYSAMVMQLTSGPCIALELMDERNPECTQENFRKICGPTDPEIARKLRPDTIRAKFGNTKVLNAVHCTDLPDDAILEVDYFFKVLQV